MMHACGYNGEAEVSDSLDRGVEWVRADPRVHVAAELLDVPQARGYIETMYSIVGWCEELSAWHAERKPV